MNDLDEYQREASRTMRFGADMQTDKLLLAIGLAGEAGEAANVVKKMIRDDNQGGEMRAKLLDEAGDCLWQIAALLEIFGMSLSDAAAQNLEKLRRRYPRGFTPDGGIRE